MLGQCSRWRNFTDGGAASAQWRPSPRASRTLALQPPPTQPITNRKKYRHIETSNSRTPDHSVPILNVWQFFFSFHLRRYFLLYTIQCCPQLPPVHVWWRQQRPTRREHVSFKFLFLIKLLISQSLCKIFEEAIFRILFFIASWVP